MEARAHSTVSSISLELSLHEAKQLLRDPLPVQEYVRGLLRAANPGDTDVPDEPMTRKRAPTPGASLRCPTCHKPCKSLHGLRVHQTRKHGAGE